jgi:hypothetical protein
MSKPDTLRAAATRRINRQVAAVGDTVRAWQLLRASEKEGGDTADAMKTLRAALDALEYEMEKA